jgi:hypothetical protein
MKDRSTRNEMAFMIIAVALIITPWWVGVVSIVRNLVELF